MGYSGMNVSFCCIQPLGHLAANVFETVVVIDVVEHGQELERANEEETGLWSRFRILERDKEATVLLIDFDDLTDQA